MEKKLQNVIENCGWAMREIGEKIEISKSSPLGEDFFFLVSKYNVAHDIMKFASSFDADKHAEQWVAFRRQIGISNGIRALLNDADAIKEMLDELAGAIYEISNKY